MKKKKSFPMYEWCKDLFPICRSITGPGIKKTLSYFEKINPCLKRVKFKTGSKVFDWTIPYEWNIKDSYIQNINTKKKYAEFTKSNLHVVNFSQPVNKIFKKNEILNRIFVYKKNKSLIPYVTSYYKKFWGFCMSQKELSSMPAGLYKVFINSKFKKGTLDLSHALIKGKSKKEIFFSSYLCHPSMANNELSGPAVLNALLKYLNLNYKKTQFSYRLVLLPETIGSIAYLSKFKNTLKKNLIMGFNLSCLGDDKGYSIIKSPKEKCLSFDALYSSLMKKKNLKIYSFLDRGSDERQYCSPGIELPIVGFCRSKYGQYQEYHTSGDNLKIISQKNLEESLDVLIKIINGIETCLYPKTTVFCEPNLSKRNLYPTISNIETLNKKLRLRKNLLAYANGMRSVFEISNILNVSLDELLVELEILKNKKLIENNKLIF